MSSFDKIKICASTGVSEASDVLTINYSNAHMSYTKGSVYVTNMINKHEYKKFIKLRDQWKDETKFISSGTKLFSNKAYQDIIKIGEKSIPWLLREIQKNNDHWYFALSELTGANPIKDEHAGMLDDMRDDWLKWAAEKNYATT